MTKQYDVKHYRRSVLRAAAALEGNVSLIRKQIEAVYGEVATAELLRLNNILLERDAEIERLKALIAKLRKATE